MLGTVLLCLAFIFACFAAFGWPGEGRVKYGWLAMAFYFGSLLFGAGLRLLS